MYDSSHTIAEFVAATAAKQPVPGGGSVAALVGALGAALGEMVVNYSIGKKYLEPFADELTAALAELTRARSVMLQLMIEDQLAYEAMAALRKLPRDSAQRNDKWPATLLACIRAPQAMAATAVAVLHLCDRLINIVNHFLLSDLAVCADLAMATVRCALYNVRINARELSDSSERAGVEQRTFELLSNAAQLIQHVAPRIWDRETQEA